MALIKTHTKDGTAVTKIAAWCSGGADSSLMLYLLVKEVIERDLNIEILPMTVRRAYRKHANPFYASQVIDKIEELLNYTFKEHREFYPNIKWLETPDPDNPGCTERKFWRITNRQLVENKEVQAIFTGETNTPPLDVLKTFPGIDKSVLNERNPSIIKQTIYESLSNYRCRPFRNINKKDLAKIYKDENLLDTLFPVTRSCENQKLNIGHCGKCWWCYERNWAFGRLE